jgi:hypothetical protein
MARPLVGSASPARPEARTNQMAFWYAYEGGRGRPLVVRLSKPWGELAEVAETQPLPCPAAIPARQKL